MSSQFKWIVCTEGKGYLHEGDGSKRRRRVFPVCSVGLVQKRQGDRVLVWLIGRDEVWSVPADKMQHLNVLETGDKFQKKICNICHCLLPVSQFERNQNNRHGVVRRPSCISCRTGIDKRAPKSSQAKKMEKLRPKKGTPFKCPICQKRSIVGVTAHIVADHDHNTGNIRDFICDSCNTGLGRFKNGENYLHNAIEYLKERDKLNV